MDTGIIEYKLTTPLEKVADLNGGVVTIKRVFLYAPTNKSLAQSLRLENYFTDTTKKIQEETAAKQAKETPEQTKAREGREIVTTLAQKEEKKDEMTPKSLMMMLLMYCDNVEGLFEDFKELVTSGACYMDKNKTVTLTEHTYDSLSTKDTKGMIGEYLYHFLLEDYLDQ